MDGGQVQYSTLEVSDRGYSQKEAVLGPNILPQPVTPAADRQGFDKEPIESAGGQYPQSGGGQGKRICGLAARTFWIVAAVVALVVIGAVIGGAVGGTQAQRNAKASSAGAPSSNSSVPSGPQSSNDTSILNASSRIAAVNWTDNNSNNHYAVFSQDKYDAIMVSLWDSQNVTWTVVNVSKALATSGTPISLKPGSALAAVSTGPPDWPFQFSAYYMTPSNGIGEIFSKDMTGQKWGVGSLVQVSNSIASDNSQLAAVWHRCIYGCSEEIYVVYEDTSNNLILLNGSDWSKTYAVTTDLDSGSGLAMFPFITSGGTNGSNDGELRLYYDASSALDEYMFSADRQWVQGQQLATSLKLTQAPQFAASPFNAWFESLIIARNPDSSITGYRWDGSKWNLNKAITLTGGPSKPNFDYIAMDMDGRFYGTIDGVIHQYLWYSDDPYTFIYVGPVTILDS